MTLSQITFEVGELRSPRGDRIRNDYKRFINRAQRTIAGRRNWTWSFDRVAVTIPSGSTSVALPTAFKELAAEKSPVSYTHPDTGFGVPVTVTTRAALESRCLVGGFIPVPVADNHVQYVFLEQTGPGGSMTLNVAPQTAPDTDLEFHLRAYWFPQDLALANDHNHLTDDPELADALVNLTKSVAYFSEDPTDKRGEACRLMAETSIRQACYADARRRLAGQSLHW